MSEYPIIHFLGSAFIGCGMAIMVIFMMTLVVLPTDGGREGLGLLIVGFVAGAIVFSGENFQLEKFHPLATKVGGLLGASWFAWMLMKGTKKHA